MADVESTPELVEEDLDALDPDDDFGGDAAAHPDFHFPTVLVGPATEKQHNTIEEWLRPIACWRLDDTRFEFDSSVVKPGAARELRLLQETREDFRGATLSVFGHADPTGNEEYNKTLSGRRARAVYAMLVRNAQMWDDLFNPSPGRGGDVWGPSALATMLTTVGRDPTEATGMSAAKRKELYLQYMDKLCGPKLVLDPKKDFLGRGAAGLIGDVQGCGEFNPIVRFSKAEETEFKKPDKKVQRDSENAPNRRVIIYLFNPRVVIKTNEWPCPASTQGPGKCRGRLWADHAKRAANRPDRRDFGKDKDTFTCRFYHRLAVKSPCEESIIPSSRRLRVRLRLRYRDPMGALHDFPRGFPVSAVTDDGTARRAKVGDGGLIRFVIDRARQSFLLDFSNKDTLSIGHARPGSSATPENKLVAAADVDAAAKEGFRLFQVPARWTTKNSDWPTVESALFNKATGAFENFGAETSEIGNIATPVLMVLDPHWQFVRFTYFDRVPRQLVHVLPGLFIDGFEDLAQTATPDTRSNWTTDTNENYSVPWIRRERPLPDARVMLQFQTKDRLFVETPASGPRRLVKVDASGNPGTVLTKIVDEPSAERLRLYDLPKLWKSRGYFARPAVGVGDVFAKMADKPTSDAQPLAFSLDDMVLTDDTFIPIAWDPSTDRVAIFGHRFHRGVGAGLHRPDDAAPYLSQPPGLVKDRNYLADHPNWTRLIMLRGSLHDVFDKRTGDSANGVVGARAAVRWVDGTKFQPGTLQPNALEQPVDATFIAIRAFAFQNQKRGSVGRADQAIVRCCDVDKDVEIAVNLHYFRFNFDFTSPIRPNNNLLVNAVRTTLPNPDAGFVNSALSNLTTRWNGPDGAHHPGGTVLAPEGATAPKLRVPVVWFGQGMPQPLAPQGATPPPEAHFSIGVYKEVRAHMSTEGLGALQQDQNRAVQAGDKVNREVGEFVFAHETGHADSLEDEYIEDHLDASYFQEGFKDSIAGSPYNDDEVAMMRGNRVVRPRHYWHSAEWLRTLLKTPCAVQHAGFTYKLPPHDRAPVHTFVAEPFVSKERQSSGPGNIGFYDAFLYPLGKEPYSATVLKGGPYDGIIVVVVRMKLTFFHSNHDDLRDQTQKILRGIRTRLNDRLFAAGDAKDEKFSRCRLHFSPRALVTNDSGDDDYHKAMGLSAARTYQNVVDDLDADTHFDVNITRTGSDGMVAGGGRGRLDFSLGAHNLEDDFPKFFAAMIGLGVAPVDRAVIDRPESYLAIVQKVLNNARVQKLA